MLTDLICQVNIFLHGQLLWTIGKERVCQHRRIFSQYLLHAITHHLAAHSEDRLYNAAKKFLITTKLRLAVACQANDSTLHLGWRIENILIHREKILNIIPCLYQHTQHSIRLCARLGCHAFSHFLLNHACAAWYKITVFHHLEEYLRGYVVWIVACKHKRTPVKDIMQIHL